MPLVGELLEVLEVRGAPRVYSLCLCDKSLGVALRQRAIYDDMHTHLWPTVVAELLHARRQSVTHILRHLGGNARRAYWDNLLHAARSGALRRGEPDARRWDPA